MRTKLSRRRLIGLATASVPALLVACSPSAAPTSSSTPSAPSTSGTTASPSVVASGKPAAAPTSAPAAQAAPAKGNVEISFQSFTGGSQDAVWNGYNFSAWRKQFPDVTIKFSWFSYGAYKDKMPAQIATGDIPDTMLVNAINDIPLLMANSMIVPVNDFLKSDGQDLLARTPPDYFATGSYKGQHMYMPSTWDPNIWITAARTDWLTKLGLGPLESLADYEAFFNAATNKDPDGNGKKDTWGYEIDTAFYFDDFLFHAFGVAVGHHHNTFWRKRGDKVVCDWIQPGMKDALNWIVGQWKKGVFDPDSVTGDITSHTAFQGGKTGVEPLSGSGIYETQTQIRGVVKDATLAAVAPPKGPGGQGCSGEGMQWGYIISKKAKNPNDIVRMINWQFTPDGWNKLVAGDAGVPGLTAKGFTSDGYFELYTPEEQAQMPDWNQRVQKATDQTLYMNIRYQNETFWNGWKGIPDTMTKFYADQLKATTPAEDIAGTALAKKFELVSAKQAPVPSDKKYFPTLQTKFQEVLSQLGTGAVPIESGWSEWIAFWNKNGGPQITNEVNQALST
ncbi:MAG: extracellular solute-binding protein [Chloroflexota bacterium]